MLEDAEREAKWAQIPTNIDILVTHTPPKNILDAYEGTPLDNERRYGCPLLVEALKTIKPRLHVFGHIHEGYGVATMDHEDSKTIFVNAATNTRQYKCE